MLFITIINIGFMLLVIFVQRRNSAATWAWVAAIALVPIGGFIVYMLLGQDSRKQKVFRKKNMDDEALLAEYAGLGANEGDVTGDNRVTLFHEGVTKFDALLDDIARAKDFIFVQYYIFRGDEVGQRMVEALAARAAEGLEVRLMVDGMGCQATDKAMFRPLTQAGGQLALFMPPVPVRINFRNHRKIVVIDRHLAYLGGSNIGKEYLGQSQRFGHWRDTHMRLTGGAVAPLTLRFIMDWNFVASKSNQSKIKVAKMSPSPHYFPPAVGLPRGNADGTTAYASRPDSEVGSYGSAPPAVGLPRGNADGATAYASRPGSEVGNYGSAPPTVGLPRENADRAAAYASRPGSEVGGHETVQTSVGRKIRPTAFELHRENANEAISLALQPRSIAVAHKNASGNIKTLDGHPTPNQANAAPILGAKVTILSSGPDTRYASVLNKFVELIAGAEKSVYIQSPYFVPCDALFTALQIAALKGVDVRIMYPANPDHPFVYWAGSSYVGDLMDAGVKGYEYTRGFIHSKTLMIDSKTCAVGTANMDVRSFRINFETHAFIQDSAITKELEEAFRRDMEDCRALSLEAYNRRPRTRKIRESISRLFSPLI